jgi:hypothetical protein
MPKEPRIEVECTPENVLHVMQQLARELAETRSELATMRQVLGKIAERLQGTAFGTSLLGLLGKVMR